MLSLIDTTKIQNIFDICKHLSKKMHLLSLNSVNSVFPKIEQFCSQIEQNMSNLFQLQSDIYRHEKSYYSVQSPTQIRELSVREKFAPLRTLGQATAGNDYVILLFLFKIGCVLPSYLFILSLTKYLFYYGKR